jgi:ADP-ribose pyrophosphatase
VESRETAFRGFFRVDRFHLRHKLFGGGWSPVIDREIFIRGHAAGVLLYDPVLDRVALVEQFRTAAMVAERPPWTLEVPAGIIEPGQDPEAVARDEAAEEAGCTIKELIPLYTFMPSPGGCSETVWLYAAVVDLATAGGLAGRDDEHEDIRIVVLDYDEAMKLVESGRIDNAITIVSLLWLTLNRSKLRARAA